VTPASRAESSLEEMGLNRVSSKALFVVNQYFGCEIVAVTYEVRA
jgi:hypothetical protein